VLFCFCAFVAHFVHTNSAIKKVFAELFSKSDRGYGASSPVYAISFLPSFFLCGYTAKEKSVTKAN
jgi:hypothetical protein